MADGKVCPYCRATINGSLPFHELMRHSGSILSVTEAINFEVKLTECRNSGSQ